MSDSSADAGGWADALASVLPSPSPIALNSTKCTSTYVNVLLCALGWLVIATQPLNVSSPTLGEGYLPRVPERQRLEVMRGNVEDPPREDRGGQDSRRRSGREADQSDAYRALGTQQRALSKAAHRMFGLRNKTLLQQIESGLYFTLFLISVPVARRRLLSCRHNYWATAVKQGQATMSGTAPIERRREPRVRTRFRRGMIYDGHEIICDCIVSDRSPHGARIRTPHPLPPIRELRFVDSYEKSLYEGRVAWQADSEAGLALDRMAGPIPSRRGVGGPRYRSTYVRN